MSTELEREIRAAFADVVPRQADPTLATSIRIGLREPAPPRSRQWPVLGRWVALAVIVAFVALLIPQIGRLREVGPSTNPGVVGASSSASPSGQATASPAPAASNQFPAHAGMFGDFANYQFRLVSETVGWVATDSALYRTSDDGHTWTDIPLPTGAKFDVGTFVNFVDADTVVFAYGVSPVTIATTHDAGASWVQAAIADLQLVGAAGPILTFRTALVGSATFEDAATPERLRIYHTNDGGRTWAGPVVATMPDGATKLSPLFLTSSVLTLNVGKADNKPFDDRLWLSTDGGVTWPARSFPTDTTMPAGTLKWVFGAPWVGDDGKLVVPISNGDVDLLYASDDGGHTWRRIKDIPATFDDGLHEAQMLSATTGVLVAPFGSEIWSTTDGGSTWREVRVTPPISGLSTSFASPDHGWGFHGCGSHLPFRSPAPDPLCDGTGLKSVLLTTSDGGHTWTPVGQ